MDLVRESLALEARRQKPDQRGKHKGRQSLPAGYCSGFGAPEPGFYPSSAVNGAEAAIVRRNQESVSNSRSAGDSGDKPHEIG
jgi:hypothetical protein